MITALKRLVTFNRILKLFNGKIVLVSLQISIIFASISVNFYSVLRIADLNIFKDREDDDDIWNPNDIIDEILSVEDEEEKLKLKKALIRKFLDQDRPFLTSKMKEFFLEDG